jgi:hypothetical protein
VSSELAGASLFVPAEKRDECVSEIFPSLQILGHPNIPLGKSSVHEVRNIELSRTGQFGVLPCFFPIVLCSLRPAFHFQSSPITPGHCNSDMGRCDEGDEADACLIWAKKRDGGATTMS